MKRISFIAYVSTTLFYVVPRKIKMDRLRKKGDMEKLDDLVDETVSVWSRSILDKVGVNVVVKGNENIPEGSCLFVSNHQGNFDFLAMMGYIDKSIGFVAKTEISKYPFFPKVMSYMHCVFIDRDDMRQSVRAINEASEHLKNGYSMLIFPEGTRSKGHHMNEFKKGSLKLAQKGSVPIVPVTVDGSYKLYEQNDGKAMTSGEIKLIIDKPIYLETLSKEEKKGIAKYVQDIIQENLNNM